MSTVQFIHKHIYAVTVPTKPEESIFFFRFHALYDPHEKAPRFFYQAIGNGDGRYTCTPSVFTDLGNGVYERELPERHVYKYEHIGRGFEAIRAYHQKHAKK